MSNPWINQDGDVVHPNAPAGGGGPGAFGSQRSLGHGFDLSGLPHPQSPAARHLTPNNAQKRILLAQASQPAAPPTPTANLNYILPDKKTLDAADRWIVEAVPIMEPLRGDLPRSFLLGWIQAESGGTYHKLESTGEAGYFIIPAEHITSFGTTQEHVRESPESSMKYGIREVKYCKRFVQTECDNLGYAPEGDFRLRLIKLVHTVGEGAFRRLLTKFQESESDDFTWENLVAFWKKRAPKLHNHQLEQFDRMSRNVDRVMSEGARLDALLPPAPSM